MTMVSTHKAGTAPRVWFLRVAARTVSAVLRVIHHGSVRVSGQ
jgi:hypothetical protein